MCKKFITVLTLSLLLISSAGAGTVIWDFENGNDHNFILQSTYNAAVGIDDPDTAGDESITGVGGISGLPDAGVAWTVGPPTQFDGLKPAVSNGARVGADGLLDYSLGTQVIPSESGTLNTFNLNQNGDQLHSQENDQIASSPIVILDANAVLTVWSAGGGNGTHAPDYDPNPALWYTDGSCGIAVISAEEDDLYAILATIHIQSQGSITENTLDLSEFAGRRIFLDVVDAFEGNSGWLAIDKIQITNAISKTAGLVVQLVDGEPTMGLDQALIDRLEMLEYNVKLISQDDVTGGIFTIDDANALDILVVSESISSSSADNLIGTSTPMMHQEAYGWDNWSFMGPTVAVGWQTTMDIDIVNDTHPIMVDANIPLGPLTFFVDPGNDFTSDLVSILAPGAELLAKITVDSNDMTFAFAIEKGAELANGNASPNRVVGFSLPGFGERTAEIMTDEAWAFFDAAIRWLAPPVTEIPPMVAHWPMDEGAGTVVADVVGGNDGTIVGNVAWIDGVLGGAVTFDDTDPNAAIIIPHSEALDFGDVDFSISLMVRYPTVPGADEHQLIMKGTFGSPDSGSRYTLFNKNDEFRFEIDNGPANVKSGIRIDNTPVITGEWVHVVLVRDAVNDLLSMYIDGVLMTSGADSSGDISSGEEMRIGNTTVGNDRTCEADIDDVRIFNVALTEDEINAIY
jgi:hypothetical protein